MNLNASLPIPIWMIVLSVVGVVILMLILTEGDRKFPSIKAIKTAYRKKIPLIELKFANGTSKEVVPELEKQAKSNNKTNYYRADGLLKFWDSSASAYEYKDGLVPKQIVTLNMTEPVAYQHVALIAALEQELQRLGHPIDGIQDIWFYVLSTVDKTLRERKEIEKKAGVMTDDEFQDYAINQALKHIRVDDESSKRRVVDTVKFTLQNEDVINLRLQRPVTHTYDTFIRAVDSIQAFTSYHADQLKICAEEMALMDRDQAPKEIIMYAFGFVMVVGILVFAGKALHWF